ncbi:MAG TPA: hypothetical protein VF781_14715 [Solirubrobacteraceae bacterium]
MFRRPLANLLTASTADVAEPAARPSRSGAGPALRTLRGLPAGRFYLWLAGVALAVAALSLLIPSTPSYDPWAWLVWGREIVHLKLHTVDGPSWKPLPVIFTTLFAPFGQAEPDLWLVVARAGAFAAVVMVFRLSFRLTRQVGTYFTRGAGELAGASLVGPAVMAGVIAALGLALSGGYISDNALGYSEGLATAVILIGLERALDGHPRQAFALGFVAALDRPEIWLFWGPYGLYLFWKDPGARRLIITLFLLIPVLWFLPEYWGSGHFLRGVSRAQHPRSNSLAFAHCPFCSELIDAAWPTILLRLKIAAAVLIGAAGLIVWRGWREPGRRRLQGVPARARIAAAGLGLLGVAWFVLIAIMTQAGFSGNNRYLVIGSAMVDICGAVAWGWATQELGNLLARLRSRGRASAAAVRTPATAWAAVALGALVFAFVPNWVGANLIDIQKTHRALVYQAHLRQDAATIVRDGGGAARLLRCGTVMTEGFQVPMVAWTMGVHTDRIEPSPLNADEPGTPPNVILQASAHTGGIKLPIVRAWHGVAYKLVAQVRTFRLFTHCA